MDIKLNGPGAIVGILALAAFFTYRMTSMQAELETEALDELKAYLVAEYTSDGVAALSETLRSDQPLNRDQVQADAEAIVVAQDITFRSAQARGMRDASDDGDAIVKVEIRVNGAAPPDGESTRYYRMRYRTLSGWTVRGRASAWSYRLKLF